MLRSSIKCYTHSVLPLENIVHLDVMMRESPKSIKKAWMRHHHKRDCIGAVMDGTSYDRLLQRTSESPMFVFPLPQGGGNGFLSILFQARGPVHLYTELERFKQLGDEAPMAMSCVYYSELRETKGLVLMRGQVNVEHLQPTDAALLGNQTTMWYHDDKRYELVHKFNHKPSDFVFEDVIELMGRL